MNSQCKILLVEDDENLGFVTKDFLEMSGYEVHLVCNGQEGLNAFEQDQYNLLILDVMMPVMDGFTLAQHIRKKDTETPIIFLTARSMKEDRIKGFKVGGDDYIAKPFSTEELQLRIEAILRRTGSGLQENSQEFNFGVFSFHPDEHLLKYEGQECKLTKRESEVLTMLCKYKNKVLRREVALKAIWGDDDYFMGRSMDVYITKLRKVLKADPNVSIQNIHNTGFKLEIKE